MAASLLFTARIPSRPVRPAAVWVPAPARGEGSRRGIGPSLRLARVSHGLHAAPQAGVPAMPVLVVGVLVLLAVLLAPERPADQAAICQRQAGELACRVW